MPIPDDPPPHEGAMIDIPYVIGAPDLIAVEVLEALPGRPISGEHLVRQDGTITLGFYGDVHVRGLTAKQAKVKIIQHLRRYLNDEALGLEAGYGEDEAEPSTGEKPATAPAPAPSDVEPSRGDGEKPAAGTDAPAAKRPRPRTRARDRRPRRRPGTDAKQEATTPREANAQSSTAPPAATGPKRVKISPEDSLAVYVEVTEHNSKFYYVQGDTAHVGRFPVTGRETVFEAIDNAGGLISIGDPGNVRLVRPARGGKQARIYPIDLKAIVEQGNTTANLQVFPGDRIVVGRNPIVKTTAAIDRANASIQGAVNAMLHASLLERSLFSAAAPSNVIARVQVGGLALSLETARKTPELTPAQREETIKAWIEFWSKAAARAGGADGDDAFLREALRRQLTPVAPAPDKAQH
jgi:protein involved in polysaccharide export with SLBB domain